MSTYFKFRQEELPVVGELLLQLFNRDRNKFEEFSAEYNDEFETSVKNQITKVLKLVHSTSLTGKISKITEELYQVMNDIKPNLDLIAAYAQRANKGLNMPYAKFGVKEVKKELRRKNVEGFTLKVEILQKNITDNLEVLKAKGYKEELATELGVMSKKAYDLNLVQEEKMSERKQLVVDNNAEFAILWKMLGDISKTGKLVLKANPSMADEYKFTHILNKVRKPVVAENKKKKTVAVTEKTEEAKTEDLPQEVDA